MNGKKSLPQTAKHSSAEFLTVDPSDKKQRRGGTQAVEEGSE